MPVEDRFAGAEEGASSLKRVGGWTGGDEVQVGDGGKGRGAGLSAEVSKGVAAEWRKENERSSGKS